MPKFSTGDKVRHKEGTQIMTVTRYNTRREYTEPESFIGQRKFINGPTSILVCCWLDQASNSMRVEEFNEKDLVLVED